jgi:hypothetical protein
MEAVLPWVQLHSSQLPLHDDHDLGFEKRAPGSSNRNLEDQVLVPGVHTVTEAEEMRKSGHRTEDRPSLVREGSFMDVLQELVGLGQGNLEHKTRIMATDPAPDQLPVRLHVPVGRGKEIGCPQHRVEGKEVEDLTRVEKDSLVPR